MGNLRGCGPVARRPLLASGNGLEGTGGRHGTRPRCETAARAVSGAPLRQQHGQVAGYAPVTSFTPGPGGTALGCGGTGRGALAEPLSGLTLVLGNFGGKFNILKFEGPRPGQSSQPTGDEVRAGTERRRRAARAPCWSRCGHLRLTPAPITSPSPACAAARCRCTGARPTTRRRCAGGATAARKGRSPSPPTT